MSLSSQSLRIPVKNSLSAGTNIIRFVPPLVIEKEHADEAFNILDKIFSSK